jgi:hypothetical protein
MTGLFTIELPGIITGVLFLISIVSNRKNLYVSLICATWSMNVLSLQVAGAQLPLFRLLGLWLLPKTLQTAIRLFRYAKGLSPIFIDTALYLTLGIVFGYVIPWESASDVDRAWNQLASGRAFVASIRHLADISCLVYLASACREKRTVDYALGWIVWGAIISVAFALLNITLNLDIGIRDFGSRYGGISGEPRALGRACVFAILVIVLTLRSWSKIKQSVAVSLAIVGLLLAGSTSALAGLGSALLAAFCCTLWFGKYRKMFILLVIATILAVGFTFFGRHQYEEHIKARVQRIEAPDDRQMNEPEFIARLEVFDRAAANFFLNNPIYMLTGTGPDLISIPASAYISPLASRIYGKRIDTTPGSWLLNIIARTGVIGLILWLIGFKWTINKLVSTKIKDNLDHVLLLVAIVTFSVAVITPGLLIVFGIVNGQAFRQREDNRIRLQND